MDANYIKVNCSIPGLSLAGCTDLCNVLAALGQLIVDNGGQGSVLSILLTPINRNAPLTSTVAGCPAVVSSFLQPAAHRLEQHRRLTL